VKKTIHSYGEKDKEKKFKELDYVGRQEANETSGEKLSRGRGRSMSRCSRENYPIQIRTED